MHSWEDNMSLSLHVRMNTELEDDLRYFLKAEICERDIRVSDRIQ